MSSDVIELFIPITLFLVLGLIFVALFYFRHKTSANEQQTLQVALDKGTQLTPEMIDRMVRPPRTPQMDLRRGIVILSMGVAIALFAFILGEDDAVRPLLAISMFPFVVGVAYIMLWKYAKRENDS